MKVVVQCLMTTVVTTNIIVVVIVTNNCGIDHGVNTKHDDDPGIGISYYHDFIL